MSTIPLKVVEAVQGDLGIAHVIHISRLKNMGTSCGTVGNLAFKDTKQLEEVLDIPYVVALIYKEKDFPDTISYMAVKLKKPYLVSSEALTAMIEKEEGYMRSELQDGWSPKEAELEGWDLLESE